MKLYLGDCLEVLKRMEPDRFDAVITDPPAGIGTDKEWDDYRRLRNPSDSGRDTVHGRMSRHGPEYGRRSRDEFIHYLSERFSEALRVTKPGGYALVWSIPRTSHWTAFALEESGWTIRDRISHLFGTGFPKSKACLKPACEDWWLAWKKTDRVTHLQIDSCRIDSRYPANIVHDGSEEVLDRLGSPSRFFYCSKATKKDRGQNNDHPTVKSTELMRWLCRLIVKPEGTVLDPFMGSGSTGVACHEEGFQFVGIEQDPHSFEIARNRLKILNDVDFVM